MKTQAIRELRTKVLIGQAVMQASRHTASPQAKYVISFTREELDYLVGLLGSHIAWCEWLLPGETF